MTTRFSTKSIILSFDRIIGSIYYWLKSGWRPPVLWFVAVALFVCFPDYVTLVFNAKTGTWLQWLIILILEWWNAWLQQWKTVLALYTLLVLLWWVWQAKKRVVVESFIDYTDDKSSSDSKGLATLLVVRLAQLHELYRVVDEQRSISMDAGPNQSIDATIKAEDVSGFLQGAVSAQSKFSLGPFEIPVGTLLALVGRLVQGPRIIGSLHKDRDILILTAQRVGGKQPISWRVDSRPQKQSAQGESYHLSTMIEELTYRIFTDLALNGSVRWKATSAFSEGLRAYRECLHTPKDSKLKLKQTEKKFIETLVEDQEFVLAHYNLGVVYTELSRLEAFEEEFKKPGKGEQAKGRGKRSYSEAAEQAFRQAIALNPRSWRACYALAVNRCDQGQFESAIRLYERVLELGPGIVDIAKTYHAIGIAQSFLSQENSNSQEKSEKNSLAERYLSQALESYEKAVALSWKALRKAELTKQDVSEAEYRVLPQLETVVSVCLTTLAAGYSDQAKKYRERVESDRHTLTQAKLTFQEAGKLFEQASYLTPYNSEEYLNLVKLTADNHFELGKTTFELEIYKKAREEFEKAAKLNIEEPKYQSHLALADAHIYKELRATDSSREYHATLARNSCEKVLEALKGVFDVDATSKESSNQTAEILKQVECTYALLDDEEQRSHVVKMRNFLSCLAEDRCKGELAINDLEKKLLEYKVYEWQYTQISLALGYTYLQMNKPEKVQKHFQKAIDTLEDKYPQEIRKQELRALLIYSLLDQQKYEEAIQEAEHALLHEPFCFFERKALGDTYFAMNEFGQAIHAWQDALFRKDAFLRKSTFLPKPSELLKRKIADINFKIGLSYLELARQSVEPSKRKASFQQAAAYLKLSRDQSGEYDLQRKSYYFLGMLHLDSGEYEEAISHFKIAEDLQFARLYSLFYLGYAYLKNTEYDKGLKQFQILLTETQELERKQIPITKIVVSEVKTASVEPLSLGEIIMLAFWGQAFTYAERDMNLHEALRLIRQAQEYMEKIEKDKAVQLQYPAKCWDCQGWILYKQGKSVMR